MTSHPYAQVPLTLISGVGRSGTTAVRESLGLHPDLHSTERENNIIYDVLDAAHRNCTAPSRRFSMRVDDAAYDAAFRELLLTILWPRPRDLLPARLLAFSDITPDRADYLIRLFPGAKILYVVRNGIEVVSSRMRHHGFNQQPFETSAVIWSQAMDIARWGEARADFFLVRHEHLIAPGGPQRATAAICDFLGIPFHDACARNLQTRNYHPTPEIVTHIAAAPPSLHTRAQRWKDWLPEQVNFFAHRCSAAMEYFGYDRPWIRSAPSQAIESKPVGLPAQEAA